MFTAMLWHAGHVAIIDKLLSVGEVVRDKVKETFGDPTDDMPVDDDADAADSAAPSTAPLDLAGAYAALGLTEGATLADVRDAYRNLSRAWHPVAQRDGYNLGAEILDEKPADLDKVKPIPPGGTDNLRLWIDKADIPRPFRTSKLTVVEVK